MNIEYTLTSAQINAHVKVFQLTLENPDLVQYVEFENNNTYKISLDFENTHFVLPNEYETVLMDSCSDMFRQFEVWQIPIQRQVSVISIYCF